MASLDCFALVAVAISAQPNDVLTMQAGEICDNIVISNVSYISPINIIAHGTTFRNLSLQNVSGINFIGGTYTTVDGFRAKSGPASYAVHVRGGSSRISFASADFTGAVRAIVIAQSSDVSVNGSRFHGLRSEGLNIAGSERVSVVGNDFRDFHPIPTKCAIASTLSNIALTRVQQVVEGLSRRACEDQGGKWTDGDHPDAIQMFGDPVADIRIADNTIEGKMQAIGIFNGAWPNARQERVSVVGNHVRSSGSWGISIQRCHDCEVVGNDVGRTPGGTVKTQINTTNSTGRFCGNRNPDAPRGHFTVQTC